MHSQLFHCFTRHNRLSREILPISYKRFEPPSSALVFSEWFGWSPLADKTLFCALQWKWNRRISIAPYYISLYSNIEEVGMMFTLPPCLRMLYLISPLWDDAKRWSCLIICWSALSQKVPLQWNWYHLNNELYRVFGSRFQILQVRQHYWVFDGAARLSSSYDALMTASYISALLV